MIDPNNQDANGVGMTCGIVSLKVTANIAIDCDFWSQDDGWLCKSPSATVRGSSFEDAKKNMATELQEHVERVLRSDAAKLVPTNVSAVTDESISKVRR